MYRKFRNIRENVIFLNRDKIHICDVKNSQLGHDLPIQVNDRVIARNRDDLIVTKIKPSCKFPNSQYAADNIFKCIFASAQMVNLSRLNDN